MRGSTQRGREEPALYWCASMSSAGKAIPLARVQSLFEVDSDDGGWPIDIPRGTTQFPPDRNIVLGFGVCYTFCGVARLSHLGSGGCGAIRSHRRACRRQFFIGFLSFVALLCEEYVELSDIWRLRIRRTNQAFAVMLGTSITGPKCPHFQFMIGTTIIGNATPRDDREEQSLRAKKSISNCSG